MESPGLIKLVEAYVSGISTTVRLLPLYLKTDIKDRLASSRYPPA